MQQILVGYDGSDCANTAIELAGAIAAEAGAAVRLVCVVPDVRAIRSAWGALVVGPSHQIDRELVAQAQASLEAPKAHLEGLGVRCDGVAQRGRPPHVIAREASRSGADLIVVGSRGLGPIRSTLLGSVSQEVVDLAPCPVLVARTGRISRIVLGTDGSASAKEAERFLSTLPTARRVLVTVVSVAEVLRPIAIGITPTVYHEATAWQAEYEEEAKREHMTAAEEAAERLSTHGVQAVATVRAGDPAAELLAAASEVPADLIVVGSRGLTGLRRLAVGSVARRVVHHARASVLIVRARVAG